MQRVPAAEVEALVAGAVREHCRAGADSADRDLIRHHVVRVEVQADQLAIELREETSGDATIAVENECLVLRIPWRTVTPLSRRAWFYCAEAIKSLLACNARLGSNLRRRDFITLLGATGECQNFCVRRFCEGGLGLRTSRMRHHQRHGQPLCLAVPSSQAPTPRSGAPKARGLTAKVRAKR
jgi:hypothetical protein